MKRLKKAVDATNITLASLLFVLIVGGLSFVAAYGVIDIIRVAAAAPSPLDEALAASVRIEDGAGPIVGSGVIVGSDGVVLTNRHIIEHMEIIRVVTADGTRYAGKVMWRSEEKDDLAVVRVFDIMGEYSATYEQKPLNLHVARLRCSPLSVGDNVFTIGHPYGTPAALARGYVSGVGVPRALRLAIPVYPGNSGGGVFDEDGRLVGLISRARAVPTFFGIPSMTQIVLGVPNTTICNFFVRPRA